MELTERGYEFGGVSVAELAKNHGTPLYVYNSDVIVDNYHSLKSAFKGVDVHLKYACKALTNINVLKVLQKEGAGLDTVSIQEAKIGLRSGFDPKDILYTPNCVSFDEIKEAVELGLVINIDELST
jgi:diaminopimelate decarboxylase